MNKVMENKNKYGQYFTPSLVVDFMISLSRKNINRAKILEPAAGEGHFLKGLNKKGATNVTAIEIDTTLKNDSNYDIINESFVSWESSSKYDLIIGNPPYIRWKNLEDELKNELYDNVLWNKYFNALCDYSSIFILKSIELLEDNGELIFITPEYWINTTHSESLRNYISKNGILKEFIHFNETPIFKGVTASLVIFKFIKTSDRNVPMRISKFYNGKSLSPDILKAIICNLENEKVEYIFREQFEVGDRWILSSLDIEEEIFNYKSICSKGDNLFGEIENYHKLGDVVEIGNGMVSGLDKVFQFDKKSNTELNELEKRNTLKVIKAKSLKPFVFGEVTNYIFLNHAEIDSSDEFEANFPNYFSQLKPFVEKLDSRYDYNRDIKYWEWVFLRNFNLFSKPVSKIFVPCKERISNKSYLRFSFVEPGYFPTQDVTALVLKDGVKEDLRYFLAILNSHFAYNWFKYMGIIKGNIVEFSEKPLSDFPIRRINWNNPMEVKLHDDIVERTVEITSGLNINYSELNYLIEKLFGLT